MSAKFNPFEEGALNEQEDAGVGQMTKEEAAKYFNEPVPKEKPYEPNNLMEVNARIKNAATMAVNNNLTQTGVMLCNTYSHVIKSLYDFAKTVRPKKSREALEALIRKHESMPADFISVAHADLAQKAKGRNNGKV